MNILLRSGIIHKRIASEESPKRFGKGLQYEKHGLWRYRVEDYRIICRITDAEITRLIIQVSLTSNKHCRLDTKVP